MNQMQTIQGVLSCSVPEFKPADYVGLHSGIGKTRKSSKHFGCKKAECCVKSEIVAKLRKGKM